MIGPQDLPYLARHATPLRVVASRSTCGPARATHPVPAEAHDAPGAADRDGAA